MVTKGGASATCVRISSSWGPDTANKAAGRRPPPETPLRVEVHQAGAGGASASGCGGLRVVWRGRSGSGLGGGLVKTPLIGVPQLLGVSLVDSQSAQQVLGKRGGNGDQCTKQAATTGAELGDLATNSQSTKLLA